MSTIQPKSVSYFRLFPLPYFVICDLLMDGVIMENSQQLQVIILGMHLFSFCKKLGILVSNKFLKKWS